MMAEFEMTDLGMMHYFMRIEVMQSLARIFMAQKKFALEILERFQMMKHNLVKTPTELGLKLIKDPKGKKVDSSLLQADCW